MADIYFLTVLRLEDPENGECQRWSGSDESSPLACRWPLSLCVPKCGRGGEKRREMKIEKEIKIQR